MAALARIDQEIRAVQVDRLRLINSLECNLANHIEDYEEAMAGYRSVLLNKLTEAFNAAKVSLEHDYEKMQMKVAAFTDDDIAKQRDHFTLVDEITVTMKVPRSYAKEYEAAIDMAKWDVRDTLELTHAEFTCFVRDQWDWKSGFDVVNSMYKVVR